MANVTIKRFTGSSWESLYPKTTISQVQNLSSELADLQSQLNSISQKMGWILLYSGSATLSTSSFTNINVNTEVNIGDILAIELRYGSASNSYTTKIIHVAIGSSSTTPPSETYQRKVGWSDWDGQYRKNISFILYRYSSNQIRAGYYSYLLEEFLPSSNTINIYTNQTLTIYITKIWKLV